MNASLPGRMGVVLYRFGRILGVQNFGFCVGWFAVFFFFFFFFFFFSRKLNIWMNIFWGGRHHSTELYGGV